MNSESKGFGALLSGIRQRAAEEQERAATDAVYRAKLEARAREARDWEAQQAAYRAQDRRVRAGIPRRAWAMLDAPEETAALAEVRAWLAAPETILVLAGGVGVGKTVAAAWAVDQHGGRIVKAMDLVQAGTFDSAFWGAARGASLLVIDDIGTEPKDEKGYALSNLWALLDRRYDAERPTILTTNLDKPAFVTAYCQGPGVRLEDRIREVGAFMKIKGHSMRKGRSMGEPAGET